MTGNYEKAYEQLNSTIKRRQSFENKQFQGLPKNIFEETNNPYRKYATDINFYDIDGFGLLHYAVKMGDLNKVKSLLTQGVKIDGIDPEYQTASPIQIALDKGELAIAQFLFANNADCKIVHSDLCTDLSTRQWYQDMIKEELNACFPNPGNTLKLAPGVSSRFISSAYSELDALIRAIEVNDIDFLQEVMLGRNLEIILKSSITLVNAAATFGRVRVIEMLGVLGFKPSKTLANKEHPLTNAAIRNEVEVVKYLLALGYDVNMPDQSLKSALWYAVEQGSQPLLIELLNHPVDFNLKTIDEKNILHAVATCKNLESAQTLLSKLNKKQRKMFLNQVDIYGFTPVDIALQEKNDAILALFLPKESIESFHKKTNYGELPIPINHGRITRSLYYYMKTSYRDPQLLCLLGNCNGLEFLFLLYRRSHSKEYFFSSMTLLAAWNGQENALNEPFKAIPQAHYYTNLKEMYEQWTNDIIWFQTSNLSHFIDINHHNREEQFILVSHKDKLQPISLYTEYFLAINPKQILELLDYCLRMPTGCQIELAGSRHATSGVRDNTDVIDYYDPNFLFPTLPANNSENLLRRIINFKYISLNRWAQVLRFSIHLFYFKQDLPLLTNSFTVLSEEEIPKDRQEGELFQQQSPNGFTPLHIAVITRSMTTLEATLNHDICDVNAIDAHGRSPLDISLLNNFIEGIIKILKCQRFNWQHLPVKELYKIKNEINLIEIIINNPMATDLEEFLSEAINQRDLQMVDLLLSHGKANVNKVHRDNLPLLLAMDNNDGRMVELLLKHGANVVLAAHGNTPLKSAIINSQFYISIQDRLFDVNQFDECHCTSVHYAIYYRKPLILRDLIDNGADLTLRDSQGQDALDYLHLFPIENAGERHFQCQELIYQYYPFDLKNPLHPRTLSNALFDAITASDSLFQTILKRCDHNIIEAHKYNATVLVMCIFKHQEEKVHLLLKAGSTIPGVILPWVVGLEPFPEKTKIIKLLLIYGIELDAKNEKGETALELVAASGDKELKALFAAYQPDVTTAVKRMSI